MHNFNFSICYKSIFFFFLKIIKAAFCFFSFSVSPWGLPIVLFPLYLPVLGSKSSADLGLAGSRQSTTGRHYGENQWRNVTFMLCKQEKAAFATDWNVKIVHMCWKLRYFSKDDISIHKSCPQSFLSSFSWSSRWFCSSWLMFWRSTC